MNHARWKDENSFYCKRCKIDRNIKNYKNTLDVVLGYYFILPYQKMKSKNNSKENNSHNILWPLVNTSGRTLSPLKLYKMDQVENVEAQNLEYQEFEELFEDRDVEVFDTILLNGPIDIVKQNLKLLKYQGIDIHNFYQSYFPFFITGQTLNCPEFVDWCAKKYSLYERVIIDISISKILYLVSPLVVRKTVLVSDYNEQSIVQCFRESIVEKKQGIFKKCFKPDVELLDKPFPLDADLFNVETQCTLTELIQFLILYMEKYITEPLMSLLFVLSTFLVESNESSQSIQVS